MIYSQYLPDIEQHILGLVLNQPSVWADINILNRSDFSPIRQRVFDIIKNQLESNPPQPIAPIILVEKLKSYGQETANIGGVDMLTYLEGLQMRGKMVDQKEIEALVKELKLASIRRELIERCDAAKKEVVEAKSFNDMVAVIDKTLNSVNTNYFKGSDTVSLFENIIEVIEERGDSPVELENLGFQGPFASLNATLGSLIFPGSFTVLAARTGGQKSSMAFYYNVYVAEKYNLPILHLDANEMTVEQLQSRAVCCLSKGRIPLWAVKSGLWRKNKEWVQIIRDDIWPRVKKIQIDYMNIGNMSAEQIVSFIKRHSYRKVGRNGHLLINLDYIKGADSFTKNAAEYQAVGYYVNALKNLVTEQITGSIWTSVQNNRGGIITGKKANEIVDSENDISLSDRIIQQATHGFSMRYKIPEELANEKNRFGNIKLTPLKTRESLGKDYQRSLMPIQLPDGRFVKNYYNIDGHDFYFEDRGDLNSMLETLGHTSVNLSDTEDDKKMP